MRYHKKHVVCPYKDCDVVLDIECTKILAEMSRTALKLYLYIRDYSNRINDEGIILFDFIEAKELCGFKQDKSVYNALSELINKDVLAGREKHDEFYYNPKFINYKKEKQ